MPDPAHRLPGRGAYLHRDAQCLQNAIRRKAWMRALRLAAPLPDDAVAAHLAEVAVAPEAGSTTRSEQSPHSPTTKADPS